MFCTRSNLSLEGLKGSRYQVTVASRQRELAVLYLYTLCVMLISLIDSFDVGKGRLVIVTIHSLGWAKALSRRHPVLHIIQNCFYALSINKKPPPPLDKLKHRIQLQNCEDTGRLVIGRREFGGRLFTLFIKTLLDTSLAQALGFAGFTSSTKLTQEELTTGAVQLAFTAHNFLRNRLILHQITNTRLSLCVSN
ncbi:hypothetical protein EYC80_000413 [Monilinia laxa]|uniref:Uncharacterized protein n=1 Tax=Monilinia laxa TaxID=61186 RepID=A0A5N6KAH5_MONLA|nr:hypothetical protein EYC80_000413 [Monilinia laxa]